MANMYINAMTALWNSVGTTYSAIKMNVTDAGSASGSNLLHLQISSVDKFTVNKSGAVFSAGAFTATGGVISAASNVPLLNDGAALGSSAFAWSDLFLASGGVINFGASDLTITHAENALAFVGASSGYSFDATLKLAANDIGALGVSGAAWSDLFLASGAVINFAAGDVTITHATDTLSFAGATLYNFSGKLTAVGAALPTNSRSGLTMSGDLTLRSGYQYMVNSYYDTVAVGYKADAAGYGGTIIFQPGSGSWTMYTSSASVAAGAAITLTTPMTLDASGNMTILGAFNADTVTAVASTLATRAVSTGNAHLFFQNSAGAERCLIYADNSSNLIFRVGATAQSASLSAAGNFTIPANLFITGGHVAGSTSALHLGNLSGAGGIYLRPNGYNVATNQVIINSSGQVQAAGAVYAGTGAYLNTDGNIGGTTTIWAAGWGGANDAYTAIGARIEDRALAWANNRVSSMDYRKVTRGTTTIGTAPEGEQNAPAGAVITGYSRGSGANHEVKYLIYHYLQVYDPVRGWVGFDG